MARILLIKRGAMGDILMATPLLRQLKQKIPNLELDFLVSKECAGVIKNNTYLDNIMTVKGNMFGIRNILGLIKYVLKLRNKYDYVFVLDKHYYFNFIARVISKNTVGYWRDHLSLLFLKYRVSYNDVNRYHGLYYLDLLLASKLAIPDYDDCRLDLWVSDADVKSADTICHNYGISKNNFITIINSGGNQGFESSGVRMLPEDKIIKLIDKLKTNTKVLLLGSKSDKINYNNYLAKLNDNKNIINLAGELSLEESAVIMRYATRVITTDCGAMHIALTQELYSKLFCFFGPTCPMHVLPPNLDIEYFWQDQKLFNKKYPLYGVVPKNIEFFKTLDINIL